MKKLFLFIFSMLWIFQAFSQREVITLTFSAKDSITQELIAPDSVYILNLEESCDTTLYDPVSALVLDSIWPVGIKEPGMGAESCLIMQNMPNPFRENTVVRVFLKNDSDFALALLDSQGKSLSDYRGHFGKGWHRFTISVSGSKLLFLKGSDGTASKTIKLISTAPGMEGARITYSGMTDQGQMILKSSPDDEGFIFYLGNPLLYTAYVDGYYESIIYDAPVSSESYIFSMIPLEIATIPTVTTSPVTDITQTTATSGGNVTSDGGAPVTARGVCWSTIPGPTADMNHTTDGNGTGSFISVLNWLTPNTPYYIRAYATNSEGTAYGEEFTFTTLPADLPTVSTNPVTYITQTTATSGGNVTSDGGDFVSARGVCWSTSPNPEVSGSHTLDGGGTGSYESYLYGLTAGTPYYIRAYATNTTGTAYGNELTFNTLSPTTPTVTTTPATNIAPTTATTGGNVNSDGGAPVTARGVCWSLLPNPSLSGDHTSDGSGMGMFVSNLTGLTPDTLYYIRAYAINSVGTAYGNELTFTTLPPAFECGSSITINHAAGDVAPVTKTTTYNTVTGIPGETSKCWITSNLGSDNEATGKNDATEASAGWYWQFNRKQGYKHDGTTRTPNTAWIYPIIETVDWQANRDPCAIEMADGWRLPTYTEWLNVDASGNWVNWNGPWNSDLKLHAAGYLNYDNGTLAGRGSDGCYWSSNWFTDTNSWALDFTSGISEMSYDSKAWGYSLRCVRE